MVHHSKRIVTAKRFEYDNSRIKVARKDGVLSCSGHNQRSVSSRNQGSNEPLSGVIRTASGRVGGMGGIKSGMKYQ